LSPRNRADDAGGRAAACLFAVVLAVAASAAGCASSSAIRKGQVAEQAQDYDRAVAEYTRALRLKPGDKGTRLALDRAKLRAAEYHYERGRRFASVGRLDEAVVQLQIASELNPASGVIDDLLRTTRNRQRAKVVVSREGKTELQTLIERTRDLPPPGLDLPRGLKLPSSLVFREASSRDVFTALARFADVNLVFDPAFREAPISIDLRNASFDEAVASVAASTRNFYRVTGPRTVTIIPDTPAKRREYEEEVIRTFYLSNADLKETNDLLRMVIDNRRLAPITGTNAITIKDTPERIAAAAKVIAAIDKARPEIVIDVELLEVDRTRLLEYGLQIASPSTSGATGINGSADVNRDGMTLADLRSLTQAGIFMNSLPALYYRLLKSDTNTRTLANPQLRAQDGIAAQARFGEMVPVPMTTFSPIATGGVAQQPITSFQYQNIGVNIDITPRTHHDEDVTLGLKIEVSNISGTGFGGLPTFGNRSVTTTIRLRDGETSFLGGLIRDDERQTLDGIPGLSDLPVVGRLFAKTHKETQETDIILTLTPHIVRILDLTEADLRAFRVGRDSGTALGELPLVDLPKEEPAAPKPPKGPGGGDSFRRP
jgi:general secretion pathway protein D